MYKVKYQVYNKPYGFAPVMGAVATSGIVFSFLGFRQGLDYAGEARTPQKSAL